MEDPRIITVDGPSVLNALVAKIGQSDRGALDVETTIGGETLISVALAFDDQEAWVLNARDRDAGFSPADLRRLKTALESFPWTMHNGYFDRLTLRRFNLDVELAHDTMAMAYLLNQSDPRAKTSRKGLEHLSITILGEKPYKDVDYKNILDEPWEKVAAMNGRDAINTLRLHSPLMGRLESNPRLHAIYKWILMPAVNCLIGVTENGVPVDRDNLATLTEELAKERAGLLEWLQENTPDPDPEKFPKGWPKHKELGKAFNPGSPAQVAHVLHDVLKKPVMAETVTGKTSSNKDALLQLALEHPSEWIDKLLDYRRLSTALNSFLLKWPLMWDDKGWLHPRYKPLHVVTGRLSSEEPNIQNIPREARFRNCFGGVDGLTWVKADYSQIELRIAAWLAGEELMLSAYREGKDLHALTASLVLGSEDKAARQVGKTLNFGLLYGAGPKTLRRIARVNYGLDISPRDAKRHHQRFFQAYPKLKLWHQRLSESIAQTRISVSPLGRVRQLPEARFFHSDDEDLRKKGWHAVAEGINHPVQGFASDLLLVAMLRVSKVSADYSAKLVCEVHDEMDFLVPPAQVEDFSAEVKRIMEDVAWLEKFGVRLGVPLVAEISSGTHWGSLK